MEDKLSREEVLHVAHLARIEIDEEEIAMYQVKLKKTFKWNRKNKWSKSIRRRYVNLSNWK